MSLFYQACTQNLLRWSIIEAYFIDTQGGINKAMGRVESKKVTSFMRSLIITPVSVRFSKFLIV